MVHFQSPVFCSRCSYLALAELEDSHLCLSCLQGVLKTSTDPYVLYKIKPLEISETEIQSLIRGRSYRTRSLYVESDSPTAGVE